MMGIPIGSMAHPELEKHRWLIQFVKTSTVESTLLELSSAGRMTRV